MTTRTDLDRKALSKSKTEAGVALAQSVEQFTHTKTVKREMKSQQTTPVAATGTGPQFVEEDDISSRYRMDRKACMQQLFQELHVVGRRVLERCQVSGPNDERIAKKSGMLIVCKAPRPWLLANNATDREIDDFGIDSHPSFVWLFIGAEHLLAARGGNHRPNVDSPMEPIVAQFFDKLSTAAASGDEVNPQRLPCELDSYSFEAVSCLVNDYYRLPPDDSSRNSMPEKHSAGQLASTSSPMRKKHKQQVDAGSVDAVKTENIDEQPQQVLWYNEAYDYGQDWWEPKDTQSYRKMFASLRVCPSIAEPVYELARAFGRKRLALETETPMVWQWGAEVRRLPWSIPCFTWLSSKLGVACDHGNAALQNYLLINLEKNGFGLTEALTLYEFVASAPIVAMYVERELTQWQMQDAGAVEWILSELQLCQASKDKPLYTTTLANAILMRIACIRPRGANMLRNAVLDAEGKGKSRQNGELCTYLERYPRILMLTDAKAQFTIDISESGITEPNLLNLLRAAAGGTSTGNDVDISIDDDSSISSSSKRDSTAMQKQSNVLADTKSITFTFNLCRSSTEFAVELARALNIFAKSNYSGADRRATPAVDATAVVVEPDDQSDSTSTPMRSRLRRTSSLKSSHGKLSKVSMVSERDCKFINWQYVEIKQIVPATTDDGSTTDFPALPYARAVQTFRALPYVCMPREELINLRTFRRNMPLDHPMVCMLLHALYENDDSNMLSQKDEASLLDMQKKSASRSKHQKGAAQTHQQLLFHYRIRLTANSISQLFAREWKMQDDHRPAVIYDVE